MFGLSKRTSKDVHDFIETFFRIGLGIGGGFMALVSGLLWGCVLRGWIPLEYPGLLQALVVGMTMASVFLVWAFSWKQVDAWLKPRLRRLNRRLKRWLAKR